MSFCVGDDVIKVAGDIGKMCSYIQVSDVS